MSLGGQSPFITLFERVRAIGLPCMVGGGVAATIIGEPRTTLHIDVVIDARPEHATRVHDAFPADGFYVPPLETIVAELGRGSQGHLNVIEFATGLKADIYPAGDDPLIRWGLERAEPRAVAGGEFIVAPAAYVIAMKLRYFAISQQDKHLRDIRSMLAVAAAEVDRAEVDRRAARFGLTDVWRRCLNRVGEEA